MSSDMDKNCIMEKTSDVDKNISTWFCMTPRFALLSWGYSKIVLDIILLVVTAGTLLDIFEIYRLFQIIGSLIFALLEGLIIADIIFNSKLIQGLRKNKVDFLTSYCQYTRVSWVLILLAVAVSLVLAVNNHMRPFLGSRYMDDSFTTIICTTFMASIIQSLMMLLVIREIKKLNGEEIEVTSENPRVYTFGFAINIETSCTKKEKENNNNNTETEVTCEKAKLAA